MDGPLKLMGDIFNAFNFLYDDHPQAVPRKIDVFAIPYYPQDAVGHAGLFIFRETKILFKDGNVLERIKQAIALDIAKQIATLWFGNYVTFKWWNELWLQESISDYIKYRAVGVAYPDWRVDEQFVTEELIHVLVDDAFPSSHPVIKEVDSIEEIDQLFDNVETSKGAAILRMIEYEIGSNDLYVGLKAYLTSCAASGIGDASTFWNSLDPIRIWTAQSFSDRWLRQSNYPLIRAQIIQKDGKYYLNVTQERFRSDFTITTDPDPYPSPYNNEWFIPLTCTFGIKTSGEENPEFQFNIESKAYESLIGDGNTAYQWLHCDVAFAGYYLIEYTANNWDLLGQALREDNEVCTFLHFFN